MAIHKSSKAATMLLNVLARALQSKISLHKQLKVTRKQRMPAPLHYFRWSQPSFERLENVPSCCISKALHGRGFGARFRSYFPCLSWAQLAAQLEVVNFARAVWVGDFRIGMSSGLVAVNCVCIYRLGPYFCVFEATPLRSVLLCP